MRPAGRPAGPYRPGMAGQQQDGAGTRARRERADVGTQLAVGLLVGVFLLGGAPFWVKPLLEALGIRDRPCDSGGGSTCFVGGCEDFRVYAQNRWAPLGAAVREAPDVNSRQVAGYDGNMGITVDGWVRSSVPYPTNAPPWNSDVWFHLSNGAGWASYAGVRALPTAPDPTGLSPDGGAPAPAPPECEGATR